MFGKPHELVDDLCLPSLDGPHSEASIVLHRRSHIPHVEGVWCPRLSLLWSGMGFYPDAWWCDGCLVEIIFPMELFLCSEVGVDTGLSEQVEC